MLLLMEITKDQYEFALNRIEELLPLVTDETPAYDKNAVELTLVSDVVEAYEKEYYPISKPTIGQLIGFYLEKLGMSKKELAMSIGVSQSRVSDYISGRAEPTLKIARALCKNLGMTPAEVIGV
ncbi:MAG: helix-turn-helix domain-containing protein [Muribaculaceae bacterium]|nr:helix-turn-helix domain-containing protein [Muribaculaceae bacterium]